MDKKDHIAFAQIAAAFTAALAVARPTEGATAPNPVVGCAVLNAAGDILTVAAHPGAGAPHAEALALAQLAQMGVSDQAHTLVVTLEPCNHHGRTGPCSAAILASGIRCVWYGRPDPNPLAQGGAAHLRASGVRVFGLAELPGGGPLLAQVRRQLAPFLTRVQSARPFVTVKQALDPSGSMIPPPGQKTFTGPRALAFAHGLRRRADAIITGSGTILADRPEFTIRHVLDFAEKSRPLIILDRRGRVDAEYLAAAHARGFRPRLAQDLEQALRDLAQDGCNEVLVEAGPLLTESLRRSGLWDDWALIQKGAGPQGDDLITVTARDGQKETI